MGMVYASCGWFIKPINGNIEMMFSGINPFILPLSIIEYPTWTITTTHRRTFRAASNMTGCRTGQHRGTVIVRVNLLDPCHSHGMNDNMSRTHLKNLPGLVN